MENSYLKYKNIFFSDHIFNLLIPLHFDERYHNGLQHYDMVTFEAIVPSFL